jgi:ATP-dependent RNA helicase RhlE
VEELSHVVNFELPNVPETYVHRIGRTGRAGLSGVAISFCDIEEKEFLKDIHKLIAKSIPVIEDQPYHLDIPDHIRFEAKSRTQSKPAAKKFFPRSEKRSFAKPGFSNRRAN